MAKRCRDCPRCTEMGLVSLILLPARLAWWAATFWNLGLIVRKCPQCRHRLGAHRMVGGRFVD